MKLKMEVADWRQVAHAIARLLKVWHQLPTRTPPLLRAALKKIEAAIDQVSGTVEIDGKPENWDELRAAIREEYGAHHLNAAIERAMRPPEKHVDPKLIRQHCDDLDQLVAEYGSIEDIPRMIDVPDLPKETQRVLF